jgi:hypothetical protein
MYYAYVLPPSDDCQTRIVYLLSNCVRVSSFFKTLRLVVCHSARLPGSAAPTGGGAAALRLELNDQTFTHHASIRHSISFEDARRHRLFPYVDLRRDRARQKLLLRRQAKPDDLRRRRWRLSIYSYSQRQERRSMSTICR